MNGSKRPTGGWLVAARRDVNDNIVVTIPSSALLKVGLTGIMVATEAVIKACFLQVPASPPNRWEAIVWDRLPSGFLEDEDEQDEEA